MALLGRLLFDKRQNSTVLRELATTEYKKTFRYLPGLPRETVVWTFLEMLPSFRHYFVASATDKYQLPDGTMPRHHLLSTSTCTGTHGCPPDSKTLQPPLNVL